MPKLNAVTKDSPADHTWHNNTLMPAVNELYDITGRLDIIEIRAIYFETTGDALGNFKLANVDLSTNKYLGCQIALNSLGTNTGAALGKYGQAGTFKNTNGFFVQLYDLSTGTVMNGRNATGYAVLFFSKQ